MGKKTKLAKLLEENNRKSPDIPATIVTARTQMEAYIMTAIWMDISNMETPFEDWGLSFDSWERILKPPVDLYFLFKREKDRGRFIRKISREFPDAKAMG